VGPRDEHQFERGGTCPNVDPEPSCSVPDR
jgi:hypothetical protein